MKHEQELTDFNKFLV